MLSVCAILSWLSTVLVGLVTFAFFRQYMRRRSLPPGPFPLPIIGNILALRGGEEQALQVLMGFGKKYKGVFTSWMGPKPTVIVTSWDLCKEALIIRKNDFNGRPITVLNQMFLKGGLDVISSDHGPCWEILRKIFVSAVRKYSVSVKFSDLVADVVDRSVEKMLREGKPVDAIDYAYLIMYNIIASSAFGQRYEMDDPEFVEIRTKFNDTFESLGKILPCILLPWLTPFFGKQMKDAEEAMGGFQGVIFRKYDEHKKSYQHGEVRDFIDSLLYAKEEAEEEEGKKNTQEFLLDKNLKLVAVDFFVGGTETTKGHLMWILLIICNKPEVQQKIQTEIDEKIGSRPPRQEDKRVCPYTHAVILETLRFRPAVNFTHEHKTTRDTELGGHKIPKDTSCIFLISNVLQNGKLWEEPDVFKPERFLDENGQFLTNRPEGFMPFSIGRRSCAGEKLALADIFLIVTRLLQTVDVELEGGPGSVDLKPEFKNMTCIPKQFNLMVKKRHVS